MKILQDSTTLLDIERMIEEEIMSSDNNIRLISDINLTYEEYKYIKLKFKGLGLYRDNIEVWNRYRLSTLVYWVFSLRYEDKEFDSDRFMTTFDGMHQYAIRHLVDIYNGTFEEFGIEIPGVSVNSIEALCETIAMHAGIPDELHSKLFNALDNSTVSESKVVDKDVLKKISPNMKDIFKYIGKDLQKTMLVTYKRIIHDLKVEGLSEDEVLDRYPVASKRVVRSFDKICRCSEQDIIAI